MLDYTSRSLVAGGAGGLLVFLLTLPSIFGLASHLRLSKVKINVYEDEDGAATEKSTAEYSAKVPKLFLGIFVVSGLCTSIALAILGMLDRNDEIMVENWINVAQWVSTRDKGRRLLTYLP